MTLRSLVRSTYEVIRLALSQSENINHIDERNRSKFETRPYL